MPIMSRYYPHLVASNSYVCLHDYIKSIEKKDAEYL